MSDDGMLQRYSAALRMLQHTRTRLCACQVFPRPHWVAHTFKFPNRNPQTHIDSNYDSPQKPVTDFKRSPKPALPDTAIGSSSKTCIRRTSDSS